MIQCLSDFPLHIPGVAITAVVVAGQLCRLGLEATEREPAVDVARRHGSDRSLSGLAMVGLSVALVVAGVPLARAEALVRSVGLPFPGAYMPTVDHRALKRCRAETDPQSRSRRHSACGRTGPRGTSGSGGSCSALYRISPSNARPVRRGEEPGSRGDPERPPLAAGWPTRPRAADLAEIGGLLNHEPVRRLSDPRRPLFPRGAAMQPRLAHASARLAELDYLIVPGETTSVHAQRALSSERI